MLVLQIQEHFQPLILALIRLRAADVLLHTEDALLQLRVLGLKRLIGEQIVIILLRLAVDGGHAAPDRRENRVDRVCKKGRSGDDRRHDRRQDRKDHRQDQDRLYLGGQKLLFQIITSYAAAAPLCVGLLSRGR